LVIGDAWAMLRGERASAARFLAVRTWRDRLEAWKRLRLNPMARVWAEETANVTTITRSPNRMSQRRLDNNTPGDQPGEGRWVVDGGRQLPPRECCTASMFGGLGLAW